MKKEHKKSEIKAIKKNIRKDIEASLIEKLKEVAAAFGTETKNLEKDIAKSAKNLAKKFGKEIKVEVVETPAVAVIATEAPTEEAKPAKKTTAKVPAAKKKAVATEPVK